MSLTTDRTVTEARLLIAALEKAKAERDDLLAALEAALPFLQALAVDPTADDSEAVLNPVFEAVANGAREAIAKVKR